MEQETDIFEVYAAGGSRLACVLGAPDMRYVTVLDQDQVGVDCAAVLALPPVPEDLRPRWAFCGQFLVDCTLRGVGLSIHVGTFGERIFEQARAIEAVRANVAAGPLEKSARKGKSKPEKTPTEIARQNYDLESWAASPIELPHPQRDQVTISCKEPNGQPSNDDELRALCDCAVSPFLTVELPPVKAPATVQMELF